VFPHRVPGPDGLLAEAAASTGRPAESLHNFLFGLEELHRLLPFPQRMPSATPNLSFHLPPPLQTKPEGRKGRRSSWGRACTFRALGCA